MSQGQHSECHMRDDKVKTWTDKDRPKPVSSQSFNLGIKIHKLQGQTVHVQTVNAYTINTVPY